MVRNRPKVQGPDTVSEGSKWPKIGQILILCTVGLKVGVIHILGAL